MKVRWLARQGAITATVALGWFGGYAIVAGFTGDGWPMLGALAGAAVAVAGLVASGADAADRTRDVFSAAFSARPRSST